MWKVAAASIMFTLLAIQLKQLKEEYRSYIILGAGIYFGFFVLEKVVYFVQSVEQLQAYIAVDDVYLESILKMIGITCIGEFASDFCRDCGHEALGRQVSMVAKLTILSFSMPIVLAVMKAIWQLT